jgi:hypothetical protein
MFNFRNPQDWQIVTVPQVSGATGQTRLTLLNVPFRYSPSTKRIEEFEPPDETFSSMIFEEIEHQVYCVGHRKFIRTTFHCRSCGEQLDTSHRHNREFRLEIAYNHTSSFGAILEVPAIQCSKCSVWNACELPKYPDEVELIGAIVEAIEPPKSL